MLLWTLTRCKINIMVLTRKRSDFFIFLGSSLLICSWYFKAKLFNPFRFLPWLRLYSELSVDLVILHAILNVLSFSSGFSFFSAFSL